MRDVERRLRRLEWTNRGLLGALVLGGLLAARPGDPDGRFGTVTAKQFVVESPDGREVAYFGNKKKSGVILDLGAGKSGGSLKLYADDDNRPSIYVGTPGKPGAVTLFFDADGQPRFEIKGRDGETAFSAPGRPAARKAGR